MNEDAPRHPCARRQRVDKQLLPGNQNWSPYCDAALNFLLLWLPPLIWHLRVCNIFVGAALKMTEFSSKARVKKIIQMRYQGSKLGFRNLMKLLYCCLNFICIFWGISSTFKYCINEQLSSAILIPIYKFTEFTNFWGKANLYIQLGIFLWKDFDINLKVSPSHENSCFLFTYKKSLVCLQIVLKGSSYFFCVTVIDHLFKTLQQQTGMKTLKNRSSNDNLWPQLLLVHPKARWGVSCLTPHLTTAAAPSKVTLILPLFTCMTNTPGLLTHLWSFYH